MRHYDGLSKVKFDMVVCDEGHRLKNSSIKTSSVSLTNTCTHTSIPYHHQSVSLIPVATYMYIHYWDSLK